MDDMLQTERDSALAAKLGKLLDEHRGVEVLVMDMRSLNFWTDFFVIATVTSSTHLSGLERHIKDFASEQGLEILHRSRRPESNGDQRLDEWCLIDLGNMVVHLMSAQSRSFFELERLWSTAPIIFDSGSGQRA